MITHNLIINNISVYFDMVIRLLCIVVAADCGLWLKQDCFDTHYAYACTLLLLAILLSLQLLLLLLRENRDTLFVKGTGPTSLDVTKPRPSSLTRPMRSCHVMVSHPLANVNVTNEKALVEDWDVKEFLSTLSIFVMKKWQSEALFQISSHFTVSSVFQHFDHLCDEKVTQTHAHVQHDASYQSKVVSNQSDLERLKRPQKCHSEMSSQNSQDSLLQAFLSTLSIFVMKKWKSEALFQI